MCFGNSQTSTTNTNSSYTPASWLSGAAQNNLNFASNLQSTGFSPYQGQQVANFSPQQTSSFGMGSNVANAASGNVMPGANALTTALGLSTYGAPTITPGTISQYMSPYMNQYVQMALNPQIANANNQFALNQQLMQGQATSAGAFGDPRAQILQSNQQLNNNLSMQGLVGNAYNAAFNTAIGAGAQDVASNLQGQEANANIWNQQIANLNNLSGTAFNQAVGGTNLQNTLGAQQTAQSQSQLNAAYNQWLMAQQYPFQTTQLMNSALGAATPAAPSNSSSTQTTTQPNNSGYGILGALGGAALNAFLPGAGTALSSVLGAGASNGYVSPTNSAGNPVQYVAYGNGNYYPMYAKGGRPQPGKPAIVGEKGPELFVPDRKPKKGIAHRAYGGPLNAGQTSMVGEHGPEMFVPGMPTAANYGNDPSLTSRLQQMWAARGGGAPMPKPIQSGGLPSQMPADGFTPGSIMSQPDPSVQPRPMNFMPTRAKGGPVNSGQPTIVGENGPEVITPNQPGTVIPYDKLRSAIKNKKGVAMGGLNGALGAAA